MRRVLTIAVALGMLMPSAASTQRQGDVDAINRLIDRYGALEDAMDMNARGARSTSALQSRDRRLDQSGHAELWLAGLRRECRIEK